MILNVFGDRFSNLESKKIDIKIGAGIKVARELDFDDFEGDLDAKSAPSWVSLAAILPS